MTETERDTSETQPLHDSTIEATRVADEGEKKATPAVQKPGRIKRAAQVCVNACSNTRIKDLFCRIAPVLSVLTFVTFVLLVCAVVLFVFTYPSGGLFITQVETTRLEYDVTNEDRSEIRLQGVLISAKGGHVVDTSKLAWEPDEAVTVETRPDYFCYSGIVKPVFGSRVEMDLDDGRQVLSISNVQPVLTIRPPLVMRLLRSFFSDNADTEKDTKTLATLSFNGQDLAVRSLHSDPSTDSTQNKTDENGETKEDNFGDDLILGPLDTGDTEVSLNRVGAFSIEGPITILQDPACADERGDSVAFASPLTPVTVDGPAIIGRKLRTVDNATVVDDDLPVIEGTTEILIRQALCWNLFSPARFFGSASSVSGDQDRSCTRIYTTGTEPVSFPAGSAIYGIESGWFPKSSSPQNPLEKLWHASPSHFYGQVEFKDGRYHANISTEANSFHILRPGAGGTTDNSNVVSVPFLTRVLLEPSLIVLTSLLLAFSGLILGILQIERDEGNSKTNVEKTPANARDDDTKD